MNSIHLPQMRGISCRVAKALAVATAFTFVFSSAVIGGSAAHASLGGWGQGWGHLTYDVAFEDASDLTLDSGTTTLPSDVTLDGFDQVVDRDSTPLRASSTSHSAAAVAQWRIIEEGSATDYWIRVSMGAGMYDQPSCEVLRSSGGTLSPVDKNNASPYSCNSYVDASDLSDRTVFTTLGSYIWSSLESSIKATPGVSLDEGHLESQNLRFSVSGSLHKPGGPVANIASGEATSWKSEMRNGEGGEDLGARADFWYRILNNGAPTNFYVKGFSHIQKSDSHYNREYVCEIYAGEPLNGGTALQFSPYECDVTVNESAYSDSHLAVDFAVSAREATDISAETNQQYAETLISAACDDQASLSSTCFFVPESVESKTRNPVAVLPPFDNHSDINQTQAKTVSHTNQTAWSITVTTKTSWDLTTAIKQELWVAVGASGSYSDTTSIVTNLVVPPHSRGWVEISEAYLRVTGEFFVQVNGHYYRIDGVTTEIVDPAFPEGGVTAVRQEALG